MNRRIDLNKIQIKPITNEQDFEDASEIIDALIDADLIEDEEQRKKALDILEAVTVLAADYERKHYLMPALDPIEAIKQRMEMLNLSQKDMAKYLGGQNRVSEVLNKKRPLTFKMAKNLYKNFGISADVLFA